MYAVVGRMTATLPALAMADIPPSLIYVQTVHAYGRQLNS
jgi:hypothetical protein